MGAIDTVGAVRSSSNSSQGRWNLRATGRRRAPAGEDRENRFIHLRKKLFIKVYAGALYLPSKQSDAATILDADVPRRMVMHFVFDVGKGKIAEAWTEGLEANTRNASADVKNAFHTLSSWMEDMKKGQEIVLTYVPGSGTTVEVNGKVKGTLPGKAVADAILATWIGPKPGPGNDFKNAVLGR